HTRCLSDWSSDVCSSDLTTRALTVLIFLAAPLAAQTTSSRASSVAEVRAHFAKPPDDSRIMMRWWWFGPTVENAELRRELETMRSEERRVGKEGGGGGQV